MATNLKTENGSGKMMTPWKNVSQSYQANGSGTQNREAMILQYAPLVKYIAGRMSVRLPATVQIDELVSAGCVGLIDAVDKFDPHKHVEFKTYAEYRIKGAMLDELRSMDWCSRSMRKKMQEIEAAVLAIESREERPAKDWEVAQELGIDLEYYYKLLTKIHNSVILSLDDFVTDPKQNSSNTKSFTELVSGTDSPSKNLAAEELKRVTAEAIEKLAEKEKIVISLYYYDELTLKEIGQVLDLTESRICQIHSGAIIKLRARLKAYYGGKT